MDHCIGMTTDYPVPPPTSFPVLFKLGDDLAAEKAIQAHGQDFARCTRFDDVLRALARRGWVKSIVAWVQAHQDADIDARCLLSGRTSLQEAVANGKERAVAVLLGMGANPLATDNQGFTPVHDACWSCRSEDGSDCGTMLQIITACAAMACRKGAQIDVWDDSDPNRPWTCAAPSRQAAMHDAWRAGFMDEKTPHALMACRAEDVRRL